MFGFVICFYVCILLGYWRIALTSCLSSVISWPTFGAYVLPVSGAL